MTVVKSSTKMEGHTPAAEMATVVATVVIRGFPIEKLYSV
jgi:hypothetical protein